jgi:uncharacterized protein Ymh
MHLLMDERQLLAPSRRGTTRHLRNQPRRRRAQAVGRRRPTAERPATASSPVAKRNLRPSSSTVAAACTRGRPATTKPARARPRPPRLACPRRGLVIVERVIAEPVAAVLAARATVAQLHPRVRAAAEPLYRDGHRSAAVFEAYKAIEQRVRELTGRNESARALIAKAFDQDAPLQPLARALWTRPASVPRAGLDR